MSPPPDRSHVPGLHTTKELAMLMCAQLIAIHAAARANRLKGSLLKTYHHRKGWIQSKRTPKSRNARAAAPQREGQPK